MLTRRELRDIRWLLVARLKETDKRMLLSSDYEDLKNLTEDKKEYEKLFKKIDNLVQQEKGGCINTAISVSHQTSYCKIA